MATADRHEGREQANRRTLDVRISTPPKPPESGLRPWLDTISRWLPWVVLLVFSLLFRTEISTLLYSAGKVEILGFKYERGTFESRVMAADKAQGRKDGLSPGNPLLESLFRRMNLAAPGLRGMRVLWVDDHPENNFDLRRILTDYGMAVTVAMSTAEACDRAMRNDFDLVITDFGRDKPQSNTGDVFAFWLTYKGYGAPILFYTSRGRVISDRVPGALVTSQPVDLLHFIASIGLDRMAGIAPTLKRDGGPTSLTEQGKKVADAACPK